MGSGTLLQLVGYGSQDIYLTGNPQITFFKHVYKRHTNFVKDTVDEVFINDIKLNKGSDKPLLSQPGYRLTSVISTNADLLSNICLEIELIKPTKKVNGLEQPLDLVNRPGHSIINCIELEIGGQIVEKQYGEWIDIWSQLAMSSVSFTKLQRLIDANLLKNIENDTNNKIYKMYIPLPFFFTKSPGLALPISALYYNEIKIHVTLNVDTSIIKSSTNQMNQRPRLNKAQLLCDYIFLDIEEHRIFRKLTHEYLIEQVQFSGNKVYQKSVENANIRLKFNHPCKELIWICQDSQHISPGNGSFRPFCYNIGNNGGDFVESVNLRFNNNLRFREREGTVFRILQSYQHHTGGFNNQTDNDKERGYIYSYSFGLSPEEYNPSGTCNFSRIDDPILSLKLGSSIGESKSVRVYALGYNVFKVSDGMGSMVYVN